MRALRLLKRCNNLFTSNKQNHICYSKTTRKECPHNTEIHKIFVLNKQYITNLELQQDIADKNQLLHRNCNFPAKLILPSFLYPREVGRKKSLSKWLKMWFRTQHLKVHRELSKCFQTILGRVKGESLGRRFWTHPWSYKML